mgnify:CR=1 FL=1
MTLVPANIWIIWKVDTAPARVVVEQCDERAVAGTPEGRSFIGAAASLGGIVERASLAAAHPRMPYTFGLRAMDGLAH